MTFQSVSSVSSVFSIALFLLMKLLIRSSVSLERGIIMPNVVLPLKFETLLRRSFHLLVSCGRVLG
jgi:hypothetical protein